MKKRKTIFLVTLILFFLIYLLVDKPNSRHPNVIASAAEIMNDLRHIRASFFSFLLKNSDKSVECRKNEIELIAQYVGTKIYRDIDLYALYLLENGYWIGYDLAPNYKRMILGKDYGYLYGVDSARFTIREGLKERTQIYPLYGSCNIDVPPMSPDIANYYEVSDNAVWIHIPYLEAERSNASSTEAVSSSGSMPLGRGRVDLLVRWRFKGQGTDRQTEQRIVLELKTIRVRGFSPERALSDELKQTVRYAGQSDTTEVHLLLCNERPGRGWDAKIYERSGKYEEMDICVWGI